MAVFPPLLPPADKRPPSQFWSSSETFLRDVFQLQTWVALGALLQAALLLFLPLGWAVIPVGVYLASRIVNTLLIWGQLRPNPYMAGVLTQKTSAQFPGSTAPGQQPLVVIQLAGRSNHALGSAHPHFQKIVKYFEAMVHDLEADAANNRDDDDDYGYLGAKTFLANERLASNEIMVLIYFRSYEGLHRFAHAAGGTHREAWTWWNTVLMGKGSTNGHLFSIMHEVYEMPAQHWESIYINYHPTSFGAASFREDVVDPVTGAKKTQWVRPLVDASRGRLSTSKGRLATTQGEDNDKYESNPYT
ncbi:hypothetical protein SCUCBS95973_002828 [Sporothrix curviconia]|uniref:Uncharacterized protein n=1 Tax=Sporothrix curviconia TaxID=1260050 RepID=A0ABP0BAA2_9PEZI